MTERVRQAELARRLDVSRQAIGDLVSRGIIQTDNDGLIDVETASAAIAAAVHPAGKTASAIRPADKPSPAEQREPQKPLDYHAARTLREFTAAQREALKLRQELGELAPLEAIDRKLRAAILDAREFLRGEPPRLAVLLDGMDRQGREELLQRTFEEFLNKLSDWNRQPDHGKDN